MLYKNQKNTSKPQQRPLYNTTKRLQHHPSHKAQHTLLIIDGEGAVFDGEKLTPIHSDEVVTIFPDEPHQIRNIGKKPLRFLSITANTNE